MPDEAPTATAVRAVIEGALYLTLSRAGGLTHVPEDTLQRCCDQILGSLGETGARALVRRWTQELDGTR